MNDALGVRSFERIGNWIHDAHGLFVRKLALADHLGLQIVALDELHGDELDAVSFAKIENSDYVFVRNLPRENQFLFETMQCFRLRGEFRANNFQRNEPLELAVFRFINRAHAALPKQIDDFVARAKNCSWGNLCGASRSGGWISDR